MREKSKNTYFLPGDYFPFFIPKNTKFKRLISNIIMYSILLLSPMIMVTGIKKYISSNGFVIKGWEVVIAIIISVVVLFTHEVSKALVAYSYKDRVREYGIRGFNYFPNIFYVVTDNEIKNNSLLLVFIMQNLVAIETYGAIGGICFLIGCKYASLSGIFVELGFMSFVLMILNVIPNPNGDSYKVIKKAILKSRKRECERLAQKEKNLAKQKKKIGTSGQAGVLGIMLFLCVALVGLEINNLVLNKYEDTLLSERQSYESVEENYDFVEKFYKIGDPTLFWILSREEKLEQINGLVEYESAKLGIAPPEVRVFDIEKETINGYFSPEEGYIAIDEFQLEDPDGLQLTIYEEVFHAYEYAETALYMSLEPRQRKLYCFHNSGDYSYELNNYKSTSAGYTYLEYYNQTLEKNAKRWALKEEVFIRNLIYEYVVYLRNEGIDVYAERRY